MAVACGKKGPPLAPLIPIPAAINAIDAKRVGNDVYVSLTIPMANVDEFMPADLARIDVYAYTGRAAPPRARWFEVATVVASVPVAPAPKPGEKPAAAPAAPPKEPVQGATITVRETLTPDELVQGLQPVVREPAPRTPAPTQQTADAGPPPRAARAAELKRFYTALPINSRGRPGPPGSVVEFPLRPPADAPPSIDVAYGERAIFVSWEPAGGLLGFLLERQLAEEQPPFLTDDELTATADAQEPLAYNVYRSVPPDPRDPPATSAELAWRLEPPPAVTAVPVAALEHADTLEFGRRYCYTVRAVRGAGATAQVGLPLPEVCITPIDVFPPAAPKAMAAVASEGSISLIWEPNGELDLAGYVVLRGEAPGDTLEPLTPAPILAAGYKDDTVKPGVRYVYAVRAVDNRLPIPNISPESIRVEETAR